MKTLVIFLLLASPALFGQKAQKGSSIYQLTIYHFTKDSQQSTLDNYLQHSLLPAYHRQGIDNVGVFTAIANDTATNKTLYVLVPLKSLDQLITIKSALDKDKSYSDAGKAFIETTYDQPAYQRKEVILLKAFPMAPVLKLPSLSSPKTERVYELRSYESASEAIHENKVRMFNEGGETAIFDKLGFNAIFYGSVIAGCHMPNLMYMTSFENMEARNEHWKAFGADPNWKKLSALPEYQHNVSKNDITFLRPTAYSDY